MTTAGRISPVLAAELAALNDDQRAAVLCPGSVVVRAGPGSGKTRTLVAKVGYLLDAQVPARQGVAAITYTRQAAREIATRLDRFGIRPGRRLTCGTLHSWCLTAILRPYGPLLGLPIPGPGTIIDDADDEWLGALQRCFDEVGLPNEPRFEKATITKLRREIAAGYIGEDDPSPMVRAARLFDERLLKQGWWDFDAMVAQSLAIVQQQPVVAHLVASRYPWLVIDEYQDLGPVLHQLVLTMHDTVDVGITAFGDPDQSLMMFNGADPRYLNELAARDDFCDLPLGVNYRCGQAIIAASHAALNEQRNHRADPRRQDNGTIEPILVNGGLAAHAAAVITKLEELTAAGVPEHHIAILYRGKGQLLDELVEALDASRFAYVHERDERLPPGELADFIRRCAARAVSGYQPIGLIDDTDTTMLPPLGDLCDEYRQLRRSGDLPDLPGRTAERRLATVLNDVALSDPDQSSLGTWLVALSDALELPAIAAGSPALQDQRALTGFYDADQRYDLAVRDIAAGAIRIGKVTLTTYHSAKGREWPVVIMPGLVDGILPGRRWNRARRTHVEPSPPDLAQDRRSFYVGLTRAKDAVILLYGTHWFSWKGGPRNEYGISRFVRDVLTHLGGNSTA